MKVCIVWEDVPEYTYTYSLEMGSEDLEKAQKCHGHFINSGKEPGEIQWFMDYLDERKDLRKELDEPLEGPFDRVIICGFLL